jgi:hypothetical protein
MHDGRSSDSPPNHSSPHSTPPSSLPSCCDSDYDNSPAYNGKAVRFTDQEEVEDSEVVTRSKSKSRRIRRKAVHDIRISADIETEPEREEEEPVVRRPKKQPQATLWLPPRLPATPRIDLALPPQLYPIETLTYEEKRRKLITKLSSRFG